MRWLRSIAAWGEMDASEHAISTIELVIFDCDGVIADSEILAIKALTERLVALGATLEDGFVAKHIVGKSFSAVESVVREQLNAELPPDFEDRYWASLAKDFETNLQTTSGFLPILHQLSKRFCVASNSNLERVHKTLQVLGLEEAFGQNIFSSSQVENGKPAPDLHEFAAKTMGVAPDRVLVIEDSLTGVEAARAAGMHVWRYVGASHFTASQRERLLVTSDVPVFDSWSRFYELAPELKR